MREAVRAPPRGRRAGRRVPLRRHRLEPGGRVHARRRGRRADVLDRLRATRRFDESALRAGGRASTSAPRHTTPRSSSGATRWRLVPALRRGVRRAVRGQLGDPDAGGLAARPRARDGRAARATAATSCSAATRATGHRRAARRAGARAGARLRAALRWAAACRASAGACDSSASAVARRHARRRLPGDRLRSGARPSCAARAGRAGARRAAATPSTPRRADRSSA